MKNRPNNVINKYGLSTEEHHIDTKTINQTLESNRYNVVICFHQIGTSFRSTLFYDILLPTLSFKNFCFMLSIYKNLPVNAIVRQPHPRSGDSQGKERSLAPSADKYTIYMI